MSGLSQDSIKAKQLAHNSIGGYDNQELVKRIFDEIQDAQAKLEAFVPEKLINDFKRISVGDINVDMDIQQVQLMFFKYEKDCIERLANYLHENDNVYASEIKDFENVKKMLKETGQEYNIRAVGTILARLCKYEDTEIEHKYIADVMKSTLVFA